jgi:neutral amino acid transport system permease protein
LAFLCIALFLSLGAGAFGGASTFAPGAAPTEEAPDDPAEQVDQEVGEEEEEEGPEAIRGRLRAEGEPVPGVTISAFRDGTVVGEATSDSDGEWAIPLPGPGTYRVEIDPETFPEDVALRDPEDVERTISVRPRQQRTVLFPLGEHEGLVARFLPRVAQSAVNGLKFGFIIAITSIGLSLVFGTTRLINFAHGDLVALGAITAWFLNTPGGIQMHLIPAAGLAILVGVAVGAVQEKGLWRPLRARKAGLVQLLVISVGLALLLRHILLLVFGGRARSYVDYTVQTPLEIGPILLTPRDLTVIVLSTLVLVLVGLMLLRTRLGKAMRAVRDNRDLAEASGVDVQRVILYTWMFAGGLAALGGVFFGAVEQVHYLMGFRLLLLMFAAVILGGLGTAFGAMAGGLTVGVVTEMSVLFSPSELKIMWGLFVLVIVLLLRPQGIFGRRERVG